MRNLKVKVKCEKHFLCEGFLTYNPICFLLSLDEVVSGGRGAAVCSASGHH